ncbi:hypothetical protein B0I35DRAFT_433049 [Stachybotrys elegans]|uniref:Uncharacterized protein n=1 Tax=Stachybotrys elegans TaxID=80388 RepID=A0A8K0SP85_9HYPO|nr:hypothetical protein B0I35DRAFT_433049 [Stachybotrys elegans]
MEREATGTTTISSPSTTHYAIVHDFDSFSRVPCPWDRGLASPAMLETAPQIGHVKHQSWLGGGDGTKPSAPTRRRSPLHTDQDQLCQPSLWRSLHQRSKDWNDKNNHLHYPSPSWNDTGQPFVWIASERKEQEEERQKKIEATGFRPQYPGCSHASYTSQQDTLYSYSGSCCFFFFYICTLHSGTCRSERLERKKRKTCSQARGQAKRYRHITRASSLWPRALLPRREVWRRPGHSPRRRSARVWAILARLTHPSLAERRV